jgi:predicted glycosyltransferase
MKILIDIGHPAHVHYFKNIIHYFIAKGQQVIVVAREKEITFDLLEDLNIPYTTRGKGKSSIGGKFTYLFLGTYKIWKIARKEKIDIYLSFASPYNALSSVFYRKPNIAFDDTEHNVFNHKIYVPLSSSVLTPKSFKRDFGAKQIRFEGTMESAYLHPKYFYPKEINFDNSLNASVKSKNVILRFVSWEASHDVNQNGFSNKDIIVLIATIQKYANVFITSEKNLPMELQEYAIRINPADMHHYMQKADLFIGESGSMATEAAYLGTHSIVLNSAAKEFGVFDWFSKFKTFYIAQDFNDVLTSSISLLENEHIGDEGALESKSIQKSGICLTDFMVWFIENYPASKKIMKENPDYQYKFK